VKNTNNINLVFVRVVEVRKANEMVNLKTFKKGDYFMTFDEVKQLMIEYRFSSLHDYDLKEDHIEWLGLFEDTMIELRSRLSDDWVIIEKRRNPKNDFLRVDIIKSR
jgi:hypothetical protein